MEGKKRQTERSGNRRRGGCIGAGVAASRDGRSVGRKADRGGGGAKSKEEKKKPWSASPDALFPFPDPSLRVLSHTGPSGGRKTAAEKKTMEKWNVGQRSPSRYPVLLGPSRLCPSPGRCVCRERALRTDTPVLSSRPRLPRVSGSRGLTSTPAETGRKGRVLSPPRTDRPGVSRVQGSWHVGRGWTGAGGQIMMMTMMMA